jgi:hypothetical protein
MLSALLKSELITYRQPTASALHEFEELLNQSRPRTVAELETARVVHELFKADPDAFYAMVLKVPEHVQYVILYTDTLYMTRYFGLLYIAHIKLSKYGFKVTPYHKKTQHFMGAVERLNQPVRPARPPLSRNAAEFKPAGWSITRVEPEHNSTPAPASSTTSTPSKASLRILKRTLSIVEPCAVNVQTLATSGNE